MKRLTTNYRELFTLVLITMLATAFVVYFGTNSMGKSESYSILSELGSVTTEYSNLRYTYDEPISTIELEALYVLSEVYDTIELVAIDSIYE